MVTGQSEHTVVGLCSAHANAYEKLQSSKHDGPAGTILRCDATHRPAGLQSSKDGPAGSVHLILAGHFLSSKKMTPAGALLNPKPLPNTPAGLQYCACPDCIWAYSRKGKCAKCPYHIVELENYKQRTEGRFHNIYQEIVRPHGNNPPSSQLSMQGGGAHDVLPGANPEANTAATIHEGDREIPSEDGRFVSTNVSFSCRSPCVGVNS